VELVSLVDFTIPKPGPTINAKFVMTPAEWFWTSSHSACDPNFGWYVGFDYGSTHQTKKGEAYRVRCVRGAPSHCSPKRYQVQDQGQAEESVHDGATGLTWQRKIGPQQVWSDAMTYCSTLGTGWRLPSLTELQTIVDETKQNPSIDRDAFPNTPVDFFWTSSPQADPASSPPAMVSNAWYIVFIHGHSDIEPVTSTYFVRCVR